MKIKVKIPANNIEERKYIISVILGEFLGLKHIISIESVKNYELILPNGNKLIVEDHFFSNFPQNLEYLQKENIPDKARYAEIAFTVEDDIPIIFGNSKIEVYTFKHKTVICGIDIFASSFFMLTRWEEYVNKIRDKHNRFPAFASWAFKNNLLDRPIVNEYTEMLWNILKFLGCRQKRRERKFQLILTHDVDHAYKYKNVFSGLKEIVAHLIKRRSISQAILDILNKIKFHLSLCNDPYDTYNYLMDISEILGVKSYFFLHSSKHANQDVDNNKYLRKIVEKIINRGHLIGYHPSYNSYNNLEIFMKDKRKIEEIINCELKFGRQHYLRFEVPTTWQIWENAKMEWDSSLGYADKEGFRCGTCYPFSTFNILSRKPLKLIEKPLVVMDGSLVNYQKLRPSEARDRIKNLVQITKRYNGEFVILWHNSSFGSFWKQYDKVYEDALKEASRSKD